MKDLKIGDSVLVSAIATAETDYKTGERTIESRNVKPFVATITGKKRKMLGKVAGGSGWGYDADPPHFQAKGSVLLWLVRKEMTSAEIMVYDEDLQERVQE